MENLLKQFREAKITLKIYCEIDGSFMVSGKDDDGDTTREVVVTDPESLTLALQNLWSKMS